MNKLQKIIVVVLIAVVGVIVLLSNNPVSKNLGGNVFQSNMFSSASTTQTIAVTSSTRVLATTTPGQRIYAAICNPSATIVYLRLDADKAASLSAGGIPIGAAAGYNACYFINDQNMYTGSVQATSTNQTSVNVLVNQYEL